MKSKLLIAFMLVAGATAFAETRFSIQIGSGYGPGYYAPPPVYYAPAQPNYYQSYGYDSSRGGAGYWGEDRRRQHERAEGYGLRNHHEKEHMTYGHAQWPDRYGDPSASGGQAHGSGRNGYDR